MRSMVRALLVLTLTTTALVPVAGSANAQPRDDAVIAWNATAGQAAIASCLAPTNNPLHESRLYAAMHLAIHDALNAIDRRSRPYAFNSQRRLPGASPDAAVAAAARGALVPLLQQLPPPFADCAPASVAGVEATYAAALGAIGNGKAKDQGVLLGQAAAAAILAVRSGDGSDTLLFAPCPQGAPRPGVYRCTPGSDFQFAPGWAAVTPFALNRGSQFRPGPPYPVTSRKYATDFNEIKRLGGDGSTTPSARTADQTQIAQFWVESSPLQWNRIARTVSVDRRLGLWENARLFGLLNIAMADGYISSFAAKNHYNYWRPVTAIRAAATDGNPNTTADVSWTPLVVTPPIPDYDSAHSVEGGAASQVLRRVFGTDRVRFRTCSLTLAAGNVCGSTEPIFRSYAGFSQARDENGLSRILVGFHFRKAVNEGIGHGRRIGDHAVNGHLTIVR